MALPGLTHRSVQLAALQQLKMPTALHSFWPTISGASTLRLVVKAKMSACPMKGMCFVKGKGFPKCHKLQRLSLQQVYTCSQPYRHSKELCSLTDGMFDRIVSRSPHSCPRRT